MANQRPGATVTAARPPAGSGAASIDLDFDLRDAVRRIAADRHAPEARALFDIVCRYAHRRLATMSRRCGNALNDSEQEELVGDVLFQLMQGSLASFRGETLPEFLAFIRTISDRSAWRVIRRKERERSIVETEAALLEDWSVDVPRPDAFLEVRAETPLPDADRDYLVALLRSGSKAEFARRAGVSRAAVTQRVQRIQNRVQELAYGDRLVHEAWLDQAARAATYESASELACETVDG
jgi:DNA-directed RNA polymerase specialized sigma24 family protein